MQGEDRASGTSKTFHDVNQMTQRNAESQLEHNLTPTFQKSERIIASSRGQLRAPLTMPESGLLDSRQEPELSGARGATSLSLTSSRALNVVG